MNSDETSANAEQAEVEWPSEENFIPAPFFFPNN
jgi:hypothetical protein